MKLFCARICRDRKLVQHRRERKLAQQSSDLEKFKFITENEFVYQLIKMSEKINAASAKVSCYTVNHTGAKENSHANVFGPW